MISAVVITLNEASNIETCVKALLQVTGDVVVVDAFSTDGTHDLAKALGARVVQAEWIGYSHNKNLGNQAARHDWILSVDADEVLSDELIQTLKGLQPQPGAVYELDRLTNYCGKWIRHCGWYPDWKPRLFDRREVRWQGDYVHETLALPEGFKAIRLKGKLLHYSYKTRADHWQRIERYAELSAREMHARGKRATWVKLYLSPAIRFLRTLLLNQAFLDGWAGWVISWSGARLVYRKYRKLREYSGN
ncbi:MAG: glycosyltransferase family 2 protein [Saprospiraceae bacterium]